MKSLYLSMKSKEAYKLQAVYPSWTWNEYPKTQYMNTTVLYSLKSFYKTYSQSFNLGNNTLKIVTDESMNL